MTDINYTLLGKILANEASAEESRQFFAWVNQSREHKKIFDAYNDFYQNSSITEFHRQHEIVKENTKPVLKHKKLNYYWVAAASVAMIALVYVLFLADQFNRSYEPEMVVNALVFKSNPKGQKSKIILPDGSTVWLNSNSTLEYFENFTDTLRKVKLEGEAYFEVVRDSTRLFVVETGDLKVNVTGTAFNVNNFVENELTSVSLVSGKVMIAHQSIEEVLEPGNRVDFNRSTHQLIKSNTDIEKIAAWKNGILIFEREGFQSVIAQLERWYDVKITIAGNPLTGWKFTGYFDNQYLKNVLEVLCYGKNLEYKMEGKNVKIVIK